MGDYQKAEILVLADKIYYMEQSKKMLERELDEKEFKYRCIPQKKAHFTHELKMKIIPTILFSVVMICVIVIAISDIIVMANGGASGNAVVGLTFLFAGPAAVLGGYRCFQQWKHILQMILGTAEVKECEESVREDIYRLKMEIDGLTLKIQKLKHKVTELEQRKDTRGVML